MSLRVGQRVNMAHKVKSNHYVATHRSGVDSPSSGAYLHRASSRDENDSHRAPSERTLSEYNTVSIIIINYLMIFNNTYGDF